MLKKTNLGRKNFNNYIDFLFRANLNLKDVELFHTKEHKQAAIRSLKFFKEFGNFLDMNEHFLEILLYSHNEKIIYSKEDDGEKIFYEYIKIKDLSCNNFDLLMLDCRFIEKFKILIDKLNARKYEIIINLGFYYDKYLANIPTIKQHAKGNSLDFTIKNMGMDEGWQLLKKIINFNIMMEKYPKYYHINFAWDKNRKLEDRSKIGINCPNCHCLSLSKYLRKKEYGIEWNKPWQFRIVY